MAYGKKRNQYMLGYKLYKKLPQKLKQAVLLEMVLEY